MRLTINTRGEAFDPDAGFEVARILREVADKIEADAVGMGPLSGTILDYNGNTVGSWSL